jgi:signal transduction histidine kinase
MVSSVRERRPGRFALFGWALAMSVLSVAGVGVWCIVVTSASLVTIGVGVPLTLLTVPWLRGLADWHRWWSASVMGIPIRRPYRPAAGGNLLTRLDALRKDRASYRDLLWVLVDATAGLALCAIPAALLLGVGWYGLMPLLLHIFPNFVDNELGFITLHGTASGFYYGWPIAIVYFGLFWVLVRPLMTAYAKLTRWMLAPTEKARLASRITQLTESRAETVDTQAAELRRIERDLHDGAQARLVALGMSLGMAETLLASDPDAAQELLAEARESTGLALSELRDLVRGIHPPILADRGLDGAIRALGLACPLPVEVTVDLPGRPPAPVESAVYFAVAETLTNTAKHSGATSAWIRVSYTGGSLGVMVGDDGRGGASQAAGGGLHGIERRLAAFDGTMMVASPIGGPTIVTMELPCVLSSVKTSPSSGTA